MPPRSWRRSAYRRHPRRRECLGHRDWQLNGREFDKAFLAHEVAFHKGVIDAVNSTLLPSLQNQEVKDLVIKVAPAFKAHQVGAQNLLDKQK